MPGTMNWFVAGDGPRLASVGCDRSARCAAPMLELRHAGRGETRSERDYIGRIAQKRSLRTALLRRQLVLWRQQIEPLRAAAKGSRDAAIQRTPTNRFAPSL